MDVSRCASKSVTASVGLFRVESLGTFGEAVFSLRVEPVRMSLDEAHRLRKGGATLFTAGRWDQPEIGATRFTARKSSE